MTSYILIVPTCIMTFCYARITCVIWLRTGAQCSTTRDIDTPRIHFVTARRSPAATTPAGCSVGQRQAVEPPRCPSHLSSPCAVGVATKLAVTSKRNVVKMTMSVIVGFVVCWTPYFVVSLIRIFSGYYYRLTTALSVSELMALGHSAINPLLYIVFSTRAVRVAFLQLRQRVLPRCCRQRRGRGRGQAASHRPWVVTPEPSTASRDGDGKTKSVASGCLSCRRKRLAGSRPANSGQRVVVFSSPQAHRHHHRHQHCYPPHQQQQQQPVQTTYQRPTTAFRATWSADGVPRNSRNSLLTTRSRHATTQSAPSGVHCSTWLPTGR